MSPDPDLLARYHVHPGRTPVMLQAWKDDHQRSSYEVLASRLDDLSRDLRVLDLACGDGFLLQQLQRMGFDHLEGLDRSEEELTEARLRVGSTVHLHHDDARSISLPSDSFDVVISHMALMLMTPIEQVLAEMARICKPKGLVLAILSRPKHDPAFEVFRRELQRTTRDAGLDNLRLGDRRAMTREGLLELFGCRAFDVEQLCIEDFVVRIEASPDELWSMLRLMYDVYRLPIEAQELLGSRILGSWQVPAPVGRLSCSMGMRLVTVRVAAGSFGIVAEEP